MLYSTSAQNISNHLKAFSVFYGTRVCQKEYGRVKKLDTRKDGYPEMNGGSFYPVSVGVRNGEGNMLRRE